MTKPEDVGCGRPACIARGTACRSCGGGPPVKQAPRGQASGPAAHRVAVARLILTSCERTEIIWEDAWEIAVSVALNGLDPESDTAGELHERLRAVEPILQRRYASRVAAQRRERESASARERRIALE